MRIATRTAPALALAAALLVGCGGGTDLSETAASALQEDVAAMRAAAAAGNEAEAAQHLDELRRQVDELLRSGEISEERAAEILDAADAVEAQLGILEPPPPTEPPAEPTTEDEDEDDDDEDKDKGRGRNGGKKGNDD